MFANIVWPLKLANIPPCCVFLIQLIVVNCILAIRWQSWQRCFKTKKLANIPLQPWGANRARTFQRACVGLARRFSIIARLTPIIL